ncbi:MAG: type II toxin-antitoxin system RelE/ParE family toxin [Bifidobacteriaceae bacterium]|jgi:putative addiction module killer protein|nr:type II toxin-antitoxin system RelE/ParE family toxin [Bifidobacteriaceae bacterium]
MTEHSELVNSYPKGYNLIAGIETVGRFEIWLSELRDSRGKALIQRRLRQMTLEKRIIGDTRSLGGGILELRFFTGPGYRIYATRRHGYLLLLTGGTKASQRRDITIVRQLAKEA